MPQKFWETMTQTLEEYFRAIAAFIPHLLAALVIAAIGALVALGLRWLVRRGLEIARFDRYCQDWGLTQALQRGDVRDSPSFLAGRVTFWLVLAIFFMMGAGALELEALDRLTSEFFLYLPRLLAGSAILVAGFLLGNFLARAALIAAVNAGVGSPRILSGAVRYLVAILVFSMALEQLGIAQSIVSAAFAIAFGSVMLALAVAFGLGGRDVARKLLERNFLEEKEEEPDEISHL